MLRFYIILTCLGFALGVQAQKNAVGIRQGLNFTNVNFVPVIERSFIKGYTGGLVFKHMDQRHLGVQLELNYSQKGWSQYVSDTDIKTRLNYIDALFLTHISLGKGSFNFIANLGPYVGYILSSKQDEHTVVNDSLVVYEIKKDRRVEFGVVLGLGFVKKMKLGAFQFEARMMPSFSNIRNHEDFAPDISPSSRGQAFAFSLTFFPAFMKTSENDE